MSEEISKPSKTYERRTKTPEQALSALMRYAAKAERSSGDARRLMRNWGIAETDQTSILSRLIKDKFIDDERFAQAYVRDKMRLAGWGIHKIRGGLRNKGIAYDMIERALSILKEEKENLGQERLGAILERKLRALKSGTAYERRVKLVRYGLSRGFEYDEVTDAVDRVMSSLTEDDS